MSCLANFGTNLCFVGIIFLLNAIHTTAIGNSCIHVDCDDFQCPSDSENDFQTLQSLNPDLLDQSNEINPVTMEKCCCICKDCKPLQCEKGQVAKNMKKGRGTPGNCCTEFDCIPAFDCNINAIEQAYWTDDCTSCKCIHGKPLCFDYCESSNCGPCLSENNEIINDKHSWFESNCVLAVCDCGDIKRFLHQGCINNKTITNEIEKKTIKIETTSTTVESTSAKDSSTERVTSSKSYVSSTEATSTLNNFTEIDDKVTESNAINTTSPTTTPDSSTESFPTTSSSIGASTEWSTNLPNMFTDSANLNKTDFEISTTEATENLSTSTVIPIESTTTSLEESLQTEKVSVTESSVSTESDIQEYSSTTVMDSTESQTTSTVLVADDSSLPTTETSLDTFSTETSTVLIKTSTEDGTQYFSPTWFTSTKIKMPKYYSEDSIEAYSIASSLATITSTDTNDLESTTHTNSSIALSLNLPTSTSAPDLYSESQAEHLENSAESVKMFIWGIAACILVIIIVFIIQYFLKRRSCIESIRNIGEENLMKKRREEEEKKKSEESKESMQLLNRYDSNV